jgi:hypothetical protein
MKENVMGNNFQQSNNQEQKRNDEHEQARPAETHKEKRFRVKEEAKIARGGSCYTLSKGKTISSYGYDIQALKNQGVQLEEVA